MITQTIKQCENTIRIENAESIEDAKKNNFKNGEYCRYFINNNPVSSYMTLIKFIIEETKKNKASFIPDSQNLKKIKKEMFDGIKNKFKTQLEEIKNQHKDLNLKNIDDMINKIDEYGMRVVE